MKPAPQPKGLLHDLPPAVARSLYREMLRIRRFEERIAALYPEQEMKCPVHLCIGQEAVAAGVCAHLGDEDYLFGTHRSHGHCIAKGLPLRDLAAELYGRVTGCAGGQGGSMHLVDAAHRIPGTSAIVGGSIPLGVGAALALDLRGEAGVAVTFFGDGAVDEGAFYESLNFAALKRLPVLFVCENNLYATASRRSARQPALPIADRARPFGIPGERADGNDAAAVYRTAREAVRRARAGEGPTLLEFETYRWKAHVGPDADGRPEAEVALWRGRCPLERLARDLIADGLAVPTDLDAWEAIVADEVDDAFVFAKSSPFPAAQISEEACGSAFGTAALLPWAED